MRYRISVEELSLALSMLDEGAMSRDLLKVHFGELTEDQVKQRFTAAVHSLVARDLLVFSSAALTLSLHPDLVGILKTLAHPSYSLHMSHVENGRETVWTYNCGDGKVVAQRLEESGVVYALNLYPSGEAIHQIVREGCEVFRLGQADQAVEAEMDLTTFCELSNSRGNIPEKLLAELAGQGIAASLAQRLAQDFSQERLRGSVLRLEYGKDGATSDHGIILFGASVAVWLGRILPSVSRILLRVATPATLEQEILLLMQG